MLTHYEGYDIEEKVQTEVHKQFVKGLGCEPDVWYWGHAPNAIGFNPKASFYGQGYSLRKRFGAQGDQQVAWYETKPAEDPKIPISMFNGFAHVVLEGSSIKE
jgi:hypothetical protein